MSVECWVHKKPSLTRELPTDGGGIKSVEVIFLWQSTLRLM